MIDKKRTNLTVNECVNIAIDIIKDLISKGFTHAEIITIADLIKDTAYAIIMKRFILYEFEREGYN